MKKHVKLEIAWRDHGIYNIKKIWKITERLKPYRININKLTHNLDKDLWTVIGKKRNKYITPNQLMKNPFLSPIDYCKILNANLQYPIIVYQDKDDLDILDGLHRLCKIYMLDKRTIKVKYITKDLLDKARIKTIL